MTVRDLVDKHSLKVLAGRDALDNEVDGFYICDLLSCVLSHAKKGEALLTDMGNIHTIGVASIVGLSCIILTEYSEFDDFARTRADENKAPVLSSKMATFDFSGKMLL